MSIVPRPHEAPLGQEVMHLSTGKLQAGSCTTRAQYGTAVIHQSSCRVKRKVPHPLGRISKLIFSTTGIENAYAERCVYGKTNPPFPVFVPSLAMG